jgi:hypothetical protein
MQSPKPHEILTEELNQLRLDRPTLDTDVYNERLGIVVSAYTTTEYLKNPSGYVALPQVASLPHLPWIVLDWVLGCPEPHTGLDGHSTRRILQTTTVVPMTVDGGVRTFKVVGPLCFEEHDDAADMASALSLGRAARLAADAVR